MQHILVCPISKQPIKAVQGTNLLINDSIDISNPIVDGIPHLMPVDGKIVDFDQNSNSNYVKDSRE
ncbi:hypothetical protein DH2020_024586 [Rehmannia glutinosa]|uniref:Trm112 family protein n=1 Tax=Rehmannia glutinosa TaxID=99300 RepID=A0ABR0W2W4_REHGL